MQEAVVLQLSPTMAPKWPGQSQFLGRTGLLLGPDFYKGVFTLTMLVGLTVLCLVFPCRYFLTERSNPAPIIIGTVTAFTSISLFFLTACTDPGFIPRQNGPFSEGPTQASRIDLIHEGQSKDFPVRGALVKIRYCITCCVYRPPRASHCHMCDACVERFDHHCPWVGNCVGKRNYSYFLGFLLSTAAMTSFGIVVSCVHLQKLTDDKDSFDYASREAVPSWLVFLLSFPAFLFVSGLFCFHFYLLSIGKTTYERLKKSYKTYHPFARNGPLSYLRSVICFQPTKSLIKWPNTSGKRPDYVATSPASLAFRFHQRSIESPRSPLKTSQQDPFGTGYNGLSPAHTADRSS